jgi:hypothetical protein
MMWSSTDVRPALIAVCLALVAGTAHPSARADSVVYKCIDKSGRVEFTDINKSGCKAIDLPGYVATPAPRASAAPARTAARPATQVASASPGVNAAANPVDFPRVDSVTQRTRDEGRRDILNEELRAEEQKLADQKRDFNNGEPERQGNEKNYAKYQERVALMRDDIGRTEKNIQALRRELANTR